MSDRNPPPYPDVEGDEELLEPENGGLFKYVYAFVDDMETNTYRAYIIASSVAAIILMVVASLDFGEISTWIRPVAGVPAGILLFLIGLTAVRRADTEDKAFFQWKGNTTQKKRVRAVAFSFIVIAGILILTNKYVPAGLGGSIVIVSALTALAIVSRTPYEQYLALNGLVDPRELEVYEDAEELEDDEYEYSENETDIK
jgi:hypothetical protein